MATIEEVNKALDENKVQVVAQVAPALRVSIGEEFGFAPGKVLTNEFVAALKKTGFDKVFDTSTAADIVTIEEGTELLKRLKTNESLPMFTSCCPGSVLYIENNYPEYVNHFCTVKSPQQSMGALIKTYYARQMNLQRKDLFVVAIMPCVVKKMEAKRPEMEFDGISHVDAVLTTREIAELLKGRGISIKEGEKADFDNLLGDASGAGQIFGTTGGVSEALIRYVSEKTGSNPGKTEFKELRGTAGFREATVKIAGKNVHIAVIDGLNNLKNLISDPEKFNSFQVIELMVCPNGCIGGGGQPRTTPEGLAARRTALMGIDSGEKIRVASDNVEVQELYKKYLLEPGSRTAKAVLHTNRICLKCN